MRQLVDVNKFSAQESRAFSITYAVGASLWVSCKDEHILADEERND